MPLSKEVEGLHPKTARWLKDFLDADTSVASNVKVWKTPPAEAERDFASLKKQTGYYTLYRGLFAANEHVHNLLKDLGMTKPALGDEEEYKDAFISSWATAKRDADNFAKHNGDWGIVLKTVVRPDKVLLDTALLPKEFCVQTVEQCLEAEVILHPGTYTVEVIEIYHVKPTAKYPSSLFQRA